MGPDTPQMIGKNTGEAAGAPTADPFERVIHAFLKRAVWWSAAFVVASLAGLRAYTSLLSGTASVEVVPVVFGVTYLLLYAGLVFLVPVLVIAAGLLKGVAWVGGSRMQTVASETPTQPGKKE